MFGIAFSTSAQAALDVLHADGDFVRDTSGRAVILRGVTTITQDNNGQDMVMFSSEYQRIQSWGFNVQQIRVEGCRIGLIAPCQADTAYLNKLASWVDMAAQQGIYTIFKATLYETFQGSTRSTFSMLRLGIESGRVGQPFRIQASTLGKRCGDDF